MSTINLGKADVYPVHSGKANAALHIAKQMGADIKDCAFLCDDDNDIDLAKVVGKAYMPTVAAVCCLARFMQLCRLLSCLCVCTVHTWTMCQELTPVHLVLAPSLYFVS